MHLFFQKLFRFQHHGGKFLGAEIWYLTGGGLAINRGGRDFLSAKLDRPVRELPRKTGKLSSPVYTSVLGLLDLIIDTLVNANANRGVRAFFNNLFGG